MRAIGIVAWALGSAAAFAQGPCAGVACSGHGQCLPEGSQAYCLCDEGYRAVDRQCVAAPTAPEPQRSSVAGQRAADLAAAEADRPLVEIGRSRATYPYTLARYVPSGDLWCSDFVSWVYRAAGLPFTGGYEGGWLLRSNVAIRRWFERRGRWVQRGRPEMAGFQPRPGDYVRIHTPRWGHSAIVRHVDGDTLHLIEGNAGGRVILTRYRNWRTHERIDGFGIVTLPDARLPSLVANARPVFTRTGT
ncbi:MAG: CHAP domain-containing protein [Sandaracinaceae bacterium]|nr:CHAP domain-containing protein [Sandaracinaceae bacterium]